MESLQSQGKKNEELLAFNHTFQKDAGVVTVAPFQETTSDSVGLVSLVTKTKEE